MKVLVLGAHSDDSVLGAGGTIAKLVLEGAEALSVIYSAGEKSPPWARKEEIIPKRKKEAIEADRILGITKTKFFSFPDGRLRKHQKEINAKTVSVIKNFKPDKIFVHQKNDLHPDHHAVWNACQHALEKTGLKTELYGFEVNSWFSPFMRKTQLVTDITSTHEKKMRAIKSFKSQRYIIFLLQPLLLLREFHYSSIYGFKYAESFYTY